MKKDTILRAAVSAAFAITGASLALAGRSGLFGARPESSIEICATPEELVATPEELTAASSSAEETTAEETVPESTEPTEAQPIQVTNIMSGVHLWTGFASCESGGEGGRSAGSDNGHAYGIFQFDDRCDLDWFLRKCVQTDRKKYAAFIPFIEGSSAVSAEPVKTADPSGMSDQSPDASTEKTASGPASDKTTSLSAEEEAASEALEASEEEAITEKVATEAEIPKKETASLVEAWHRVYDADPAGFTNLQISWFAKLYYPACVRQCAARGIDLNSSNYSPVLRGTLWSICIWAGSGGLQKVVDKLEPTMTEQEMLDTCYTEDTASLKTKTARYITRWTVRQPELAKKAYERWSAGKSISEYVP